jgi:hypothetical protein
MPVASTAHPRSRRPSHTRPKGPRKGRGALAGTGSAARVRWDRLGRAAMLCVLAALVYLYLSAGVHMLSTWRQSQHDGAAVTSMEREHRLLVRQHESLSNQSTLESEARRLGMMKKGEQPYVVGSLPNN